MKFKITKGLDLKMDGAAMDRTLDFALPGTFHIRPADFRWLKPKLLVQAGDRVEIGTPLFCDKQDERIVIVSPVAGSVQEIVRGEKRVIEEITIARDVDAPTEKTVHFEPPTDGESVRKLLLQNGLWPCLRQRPYSTIPNPDAKPKAVFVSCFDSNPLAPDFNVLMRDKEEDLKTLTIKYLRQPRIFRSTTSAVRTPLEMSAPRSTASPPSTRAKRSGSSTRRMSPASDAFSRTTYWLLIKPLR